MVETGVVSAQGYAVCTPLGSAPFVQAPLPGPKARALIERDHATSSPSNTRDYPLAVERALGCIVEDVDGNRFLDFAAGIAVCATGHCHPAVVSAIRAQSEKLIHICGSDFYYPVMVELMERLCAVTPGGFAKRVLLTNSGAEAIEATIKLARFHTRRKWIIAFFGAFHGRTMGALALTSSKARQQERFHPLVPMVAHVPFNDADAIEQQLFRYRMNPEEVAAIFVEAIQGEGGYLVAEPAFMRKLRGICDRHGILLVIDEIQSGMGRTGKWFACDHFEVVPDIVCTAKGIASGMPIGAVVARADVMSWPPGAQGSTFGGNPVSCAAALATIREIENGLMANAARLGEHLMRRLGELSARHVCMARPRGLGLMCGVDVVHPATGDPDAGLRMKILQESFSRGLILLGCGANAIRFCPPLTVCEPELDAAMAILDAAIGACAN